MKKLTYFIIGTAILTSCTDKKVYPIYELKSYQIVPDSLKEKQRC